MKKIDLLIATRNRLEKLKRTITSVPQLDNLRINIICDADKITAKYYMDNGLFSSERFKVFLIPHHSGAVACRNYVIPKCEDGVLYATDDIIFESNSIENAFNIFNKKFPDDDGVVGFIITKVSNYHPTGVALVGKKFIDRYPGRQLFYPGYFHFSCQEILWHSEKLGKFYQEKTSIVQHFHPDFHRQEMDDTHREARIHRKRDHDLIKLRQQKGLIWGFNG